MALANTISFTVGGVAVIDLSLGDQTTDLIVVTGNQGFAIEAINATGLNGSPTWTLRATNVNDTASLKDFDASFAKDVAIDDARYSKDIVKFNYFALEIKAVDTTVGTIEFIYTVTI